MWIAKQQTLVSNLNEACEAYRNKTSFIKECHKRGFIQPEHVPSEENLADGFSKPLDPKKFELWRDRIGVRHIDTNPKEE